MPNSQLTPVVLLVEDELFVRMTALDMLEEAGCTVLEATSGATALEFARTAPRIDMMMTDVGLPDIVGPDLYRAIRAFRPGLPVVFVTGYDIEPLRAEFEGDPLVRLLGKPFQFRELEQLIADALTCQAPDAA